MYKKSFLKTPYNPLPPCEYWDHPHQPNTPPGMEGLYVIVIFKSELDDSDFTKNCQYTLPLRFFFLHFRLDLMTGNFGSSLQSQEFYRYVCACDNHIILISRSSGTVGQSVHLACGRLGVRIPAVADLSCKNRQGQLQC